MSYSFDTPFSSNTGSTKGSEVLLQGLDLTTLSGRDVISVDTRHSLYKILLLEPDDQEPPLWLAEVQGSGVFFTDPTQLYLIGSDSGFFRRHPGQGVNLQELINCHIVQQLPLVVTDEDDTCIVLSPTEHVWVNGQRFF